MIYGMIEWQFNQFEFRKNLFQFQTDKLVEAVIVVNVQESATDQVFPQVCSLFCVKHYIAVTRHINVWIQEQVTAANLYNVFIGSEVHPKFSVTEFNKIRQSGFIGIPVAAAIIL